MPVIYFEGNIFGDDCEADMPSGGSLADLCDDIRAPVPFSCRSATCGTCRIEILQGAELFEPPDEPEAELLMALADRPEVRLACQAGLKAAAGLVRLRIADEEL